MWLLLSVALGRTVPSRACSVCRGSPVLRERRNAAGSADPLRVSSMREQRVSMSAEGLASEGDVLVGGVDVADASLERVTGVHGARAGDREGLVYCSDGEIHRPLAGEREPRGLLAAECRS